MRKKDHQEQFEVAIAGVSPELFETVIPRILTGKRIFAIRELRDVAHLEIKEAMKIVDKITDLPCHPREIVERCQNVKDKYPEYWL